MPLSSPPTAVAPFDKGRLSAGITAAATTLYVAPIFKTVAGVRVKQGINTTSGCAIISAGDFTELITYTGISVDAVTKVTTITGLTRGRDPTQTTASGSFAGGTGRIWAKGAKFTVVADVTYFQSGVFTSVANTFTAKQTFADGIDLSGTTKTITVASMTTAQRDAIASPANGMIIYNTTIGIMQQYTGGAWASIGTDATANGSTTVSGKYEEATVAEQGTATATGSTGARLVPAVANLVKTSSGAGDENKLPVLNASGQMASGFIDTSGIAAVPTGSITQWVSKTAPSGWLLCFGQAVSRSTFAALFTAIAPSLGTVTVTIASPAVFSFTAHGLVAGDPIYLTTTGALPTSLAANTLYFLISTGLTADAFRVSATREGVAINTSGSQSGTHTLRSCPFGLGDGSTTFNIVDLRGRFALGFDLMGAGSATTRVTSPTGSNISETAAGAETHVLTTAQLAAHTHKFSDYFDSGGSLSGKRGGAVSNGTSLENTSTVGSNTAHNNMPPYLTLAFIIKT